jgi:ABC-type Mn2+/Zn2+ transport system ATPase subunit
VLREPKQEIRNTPATIEFRHLTVGYNRRPVLADLSLTVPAGAMVAVVGPNGAGKSTLFKALVGLLPILAGEARVADRPSVEARNRVAYVPQREEVDWRFPISVLDVVLMGRYGHVGWLRRPGAADRAFAQRGLDSLGIGSLASRPIGDLSGGQQQRVFLARALAQEPDVLLLDEPFAGVDAPTQESMLDLLDDLNARGITIIVSTHDLPLATSRFGQLLLLNHRLVAFGPPADIVTAESLGATFGSQVLFYQNDLGTIAIADHCCPADEPDARIESLPTERQRRA